MALWANPPMGTGWLPQNDNDPPPSKSLNCQAKSEDFERKLSARFVIREDILAQNQGNPRQTSALLHLPYEVLLLIYGSIAHAPSQIRFALSCKRIAFVAQETNLNLSMTSAKYAGFLPIAVFDVPDLMSSLQAWMPTTLKLCGHCLTYRPSEAEYWHSVKGFERNDLWDTKNSWNFKDASWRKQSNDICPSCRWSCTMSDHVDCDGCRALGRLGDVDFSRLSDSWRKRTQEAL